MTRDQLLGAVPVREFRGRPFYVLIQDIPEPWRQQFVEALCGSACAEFGGEGDCAYIHDWIAWVKGSWTGSTGPTALSGAPIEPERDEGLDRQARARQDPASMQRDPIRDAAIARCVAELAELTRATAPEGFDADRAFRDWAQIPHPALGGQKPTDLLSTSEGADVVFRLLQSILLCSSYW